MKRLKLFSMCAIALTMAFTSCKTETPPVNLDDIVEDGMYIKGEASTFTTLKAKAQLKATTVENDNNSVRAGLSEIYIPLEAGKTFNIVEVSGSTQTVYGPATDFASVNQTGVADEMTATIQKGKYIAGGTFTVPTSGLYHIVLDKQTTTVVILPVATWAIIGAATPLGWSDNVLAAKGTFSKDSMVFEATNMVLNSGEYKFRHSGAWKQTIVAEPVIKVNTNFGGTLAALVPGGANIVFPGANRGKYTVIATWGKNSGMKISMTKTGDVAMTDWTNCEIELVGSGVDATNVGAKADATSGWNWGNTLSAGKPAKAGNVYTWTWNSAILKAEGFKIRTIDAKVSGGVAAFDAGFSIVDATASTGVVDDGGNIKASVAGNYRIILTIDAANGDTKKVVITKL